MIEGRDGVREDGELEDNSEDADTDAEEKAEPSAEDCCGVLRLMLLFTPFRCINSIKRLTSFSDNCWPELVCNCARAERRN